jgi:hypothetical protein
MGEGKEMKNEKASFYLGLGAMVAGIFHGNVLMNVYCLLYMVFPIVIIVLALAVSTYIVNSIESKCWGRE